jgi:NADH:ubiquinone oxidoreductase subunit 3 (subunit A)
MADIILSPPIAFLIYLLLVGLLSGMGRALAGQHETNPLKESGYTGGEKMGRQLAAPGYRPFFLTALFFAIVHLGVLVLSSGGLTPIVGVYITGLMLALLALILG